MEQGDHGSAVTLPSLSTRQLEASDASQMRNVQRRLHSGLGCQCVGIDLDTTDIRAIFSEPVTLTGPGRTMGTELGGATRSGTIGVPALTGVSFSLKAVSGWSAMGTMDTKVTMVIRESTNAHRLRFTTGTPQVNEPYCRFG